MGENGSHSIAKQCSVALGNLWANQAPDVSTEHGMVLDLYEGNLPRRLNLCGMHTNASLQGEEEQHPPVKQQEEEEPVKEETKEEDPPVDEEEDSGQRTRQS